MCVFLFGETKGCFVYCGFDTTKCLCVHVLFFNVPQIGQYRRVNFSPLNVFISKKGFSADKLWFGEFFQVPCAQEATWAGYYQECARVCAKHCIQYVTHVKCLIHLSEPSCAQMCASHLCPACTVWSRMAACGVRVCESECLSLSLWGADRGSSLNTTV